MAEISKINANNTTYDIKDATARSQIASKQDELSQSQLAAANSGIDSTKVEQIAKNTFAIGAVANAGAKNLLKFRDGVPSASAGNVYAKINADGTLSVGLTSGTTATAQLVFTLGSITNYRNGKLILSGCPAGGNYQSGYALYVSNDGSTAQADTGSGATLPIVTGITSSVIALMVRRGTTISSELTFQPMVRDASIVDSTFVPYAKTNRELTVENDSQQSEIDYAVNTGVKNLCKITTPSATYGSLTFTVNDDGTISADGSSGSTDKFFYLTTEEAGDDPQSYQNCILTGCPSGGSSSTYEILTNVDTVRDYGNGVLITSSNPTRIVIAIRKNQTVSNLVFKPMIRPASIVDSTFVPYAKTNCELTVVEDEDRAVLIEQVDNSAKNIANFTSTTKTVFDTSTSRGVTITRNGDIFTVSGTSDTNDNIFFNIYYEGSTTTKIIPPGNWVALIENYTGDVVKDIAIQIATPSTKPKVYGVPVQFSLSGSESGNWLRVNLRPSTTYNGSFRLMICTAADWAISQAYQPYRPSWHEMYQMILALQNGTRSAPALAMAEPEPIEEESR